MRATRVGGVLLLIAVLVGMSQYAGLAQAQAAQTFTLNPGGTATVTFEAFCTDFGQNFPDGVEVPNALAPDNVRAALAYIQSQGLAADEAQALEAQYGLWRVVGATNSPQGGQGATDVVNAATTPPAAPQGTSVLDAVAANQVRVAVASWQPLGQPVDLGSVTDNFYGRGTLTVENTSNQALTLYHPVGALYAPVQAGAQTMAAYATDVQVQNPATPTPQPTTAPTTAAPAPTTAAPAAPTAPAGGQPAQLPRTAGENDVPWLAAMFLMTLGVIACGWMIARQVRG